MCRDDDLFEPLGRSRKTRQLSERLVGDTTLLTEEEQRDFVLAAQARGANDDGDALD